jgi:hypothetical protein
MNKRLLTIVCFSLVLAITFAQNGIAGEKPGIIRIKNKKDRHVSPADSTAARTTVMGIIKEVIKASGSFNMNAVADYYAPNAVVADEEPPFSWNGPTAGAQWISAVEKACKDLKLEEFNGKVGRVTIYLQTDESIYVVVPVDYTGEIHGEPFEEDGAFSFVFRMVNDKWLIKSQVWVTKKGM